MSLNILVYDIETVGEMGSNFVENIELTIAGVYSYLRDEYVGYTKDDIDAMNEEFKKADLLVGYNSDHVDAPILNTYMAFDLTAIPSLDLLKYVRARTGRRIKLDSIAGATLSEYKSGSGLEAMDLYREGRWEELYKYCLDDVKITKDVFDFAREYQYLAYNSKDGWLRLKIPLEFDVEEVIKTQKQQIQYQFL
jgi:DEAD/DEAH box helicase domain-containing protein